LEAGDADDAPECSRDSSRKNASGHQRSRKDKTASESYMLLGDDSSLAMDREQQQDCSTEREGNTGGCSSTRGASPARAPLLQSDHDTHGEDPDVTNQNTTILMQGQEPSAAAEVVHVHLASPRGEDLQHEPASVTEAHADEPGPVLRTGMAEQLSMWSRSVRSLGLSADIEPVQAEQDTTIEMRDLSQQLQEPAQDFQSGRGSAERRCFICLTDGDRGDPLVSCCTTCYGCTHITCWREWRTNQRMTALRSRLLGLHMQTNHLLRCTICKSGTAVVPGEEDGLEWMNELLCGSENGGDDSLPRTLPNTAQNEADVDPEDMLLEGLSDTRVRTVLLVHVLIMIFIMMLACAFMAVKRFYAGDIIICCIIALYELCVFQIVVIVLVRRRHALTQAFSGQARATNDEIVV